MSRNVIPKENYKVTEDCLKIIAHGRSGYSYFYEKYQYSFNEFVTLDRLVEEVNMRYPDDEILIITVIAEDGLSGRVLRFDSLFGTWSEVGTTCGYA